MKGIETELIINSVRTRKDGSVGLSAETPELNDEETLNFLKLRNTVLKAILVPQFNENVPVYKIDKEVGQKTPSQRLYNVLYVLYEQSGSNEEWRVWYDRTMEGIINKVKERLA